MLSLLFAVWMMMFTSAVADSCSSDYVVDYGCDVTYGTVLETFSNIGSLVVCVGRCNRDDTCLSVKYKPDTRVCHLNSERYNTLNTGCQSIVYSKVNTTSCRKLVGHSCVSSAECSSGVANSQCSSNKCQCNPGYSYRYISESCDTSCDVYGSTFTEYPGTKLGGYNDKSFTNVLTGEDCQQLCVAESTFVCRTADFMTASNKCILSTETAFTVPNAYVASGSQNHSHRNCQ